MVKLNSLKKATISNLFLNRKKLILNIFQFLEQKALLKLIKKSLSLTFIMKKKIGNAVKRNKIKEEN